MTPFDTAVTSRLALWQRNATLAAGAGIVIAAVGLFFDHPQFLRSYLYGYVLWTGMSIGCWGILLLHHTVGGK